MIEIIKNLFRKKEDRDIAKLNLIEEVNQMPKPKEENYEEEEDEEIVESDEDEATEDAEEEPEEEKPEKKEKVAKPVKEEEKINAVDVLRNHEERLRNLESAIFRLKAI